MMINHLKILVIKKLKKKQMNVSKKRKPYYKNNKQIKKLEKQSNKESKYVSVQDTNVQSSFSAILLNGLQIGTQNYQRVGNKVHFIGLRILGVLNQLAVLPDSSSGRYFRIIIVNDKQSNGSNVPFNQLFGSTDFFGVNSYTTVGNILMQYRDRFEMLYSKLIAFPQVINNLSTGIQVMANGGSTGGNSAQSTVIDDYIPIDVPSYYNQGLNSGGIGDINSGAISMYLIQNSVTNGAIGFTYNIESCFEDN